MPTQLRESHALTAEAVAGAPGRFRIQLINPGWGSSGYYAPEVLEAAGNAQVFPAGTKMYLDHPSYSEAMDRPERSVRDIAGQLTEAAHWDADAQALVAEAQVFSPYRAVLAEMKDAIGVSIRAAATVESGEAEGRAGTIITELVEGISADFVTDAGRGGRIAQVLESARVVERAVSRGIAEATANDTRDALQTALRDANPGERVYVWVRDFDDTNVWFELETPDGSGTYQVSYELASDGTASLGSDPVEVSVRTQYVPVLPAGQSTTQESEEDTMPQIEEARLRQLEEAAGRVQALEAERDTAVAERDQLRSENAQLRAGETARTRARSRVTEANADLVAATVDRIVEAATANIPITEAGQLDEAAFDARVDAARTREETYLAGLAEAAGAGTVRGFGHTTSTSGSAGGSAVSESDLDALDAETFGPIVKGA